VFDGNANMLQNFFAYVSTFTGGVRVAAGIMSPTSTSADIITGAGVGVGVSGRPNVKAFNSLSQPIDFFFAYHQSFVGGIYVAGRAS